MALSLTLVTATVGSFGQPAQLAQKGGQGWLRVRVATLTGDAAYPSGPTGGYALATSTVQLPNLILGVTPIATATPTTPYPYWDYTGQVLRFYDGSTNTTPSEVASGTSLTGVTWRVIVWGF
jgi:hypothetical protein